MGAATWQEFLAAQEKEEYCLEPDQVSALKTLFSDPNIPVSVVAKQFAAPWLRELEEQPGVPSNTPSVIWRTVADAIRELSEYNDKLVDLVVEMSKLPNDTLYSMADKYYYWVEFVLSCKSSEFHTNEP
jgi:hypothetical protein